MMKEFKGHPVSSGKVVSRVCVYSAFRHDKAAYDKSVSEKAVPGEIDRFRQGIKSCSKELDAIADNVSRNIGKVESEIFITQKHILNDPLIVEKVIDIIKKEKKRAEGAVIKAFTEFEDKFTNLDNFYLKERLFDIREIQQRLIGFLSNSRPGFNCEGQKHCSLGRNRIVVAEELTAEMTVNMNLNTVRGIVTERGGYTSHAAIIARSVGVPAVSGVKGIYKEVNCGDSLLLDGDTGEIILRPDAEKIREVIPVDYESKKDVCLLASPEGTTTMANVSLMDDVKQAVNFHADGIGLFRTEVLFIKAGRILSEDEQFKFYRQTMEIINGKPVTFRLVDIGGDKDLPFLTARKESNPFLGLRGARFLLENREILETQLKALVRLAKFYKIQILLPMVVDSSQLDQLIEVVKEIISCSDTVTENIKIGTMFEVPSACIQAERIMKKVDFSSIGSNDLIQYLFAVDRTNELVSNDFDPDHTALWDVFSILSEAAKKTNTPLSICGEMAGRTGVPSKLLNAGIKNLSVSPRLIPRVREEMARHLDTGLNYQHGMKS